MVGLRSVGGRGRHGRHGGRGRRGGPQRRPARRAAALGRGAALAGAGGALQHGAPVGRRRRDAQLRHQHGCVSSPQRLITATDATDRIGAAETEAAATALWRGPLLACGFADGAVRAWDERAPAAPVLSLQDHCAPVLCAAHRTHQPYTLLTGWCAPASCSKYICMQFYPQILPFQLFFNNNRNNEIYELRM